MSDTLTPATQLETCERCGMPADELHLDHDPTDTSCPVKGLGFCWCESVCATCCKTCNGADA